MPFEIILLDNDIDIRKLTKFERIYLKTTKLKFCLTWDDGIGILHLEH